MPADLRIDDDRLAAVLASVGEHLLVDEPQPAAAEATGKRPWRPLLAAAVVLAVVAGTVAAIAPARRAVGGWFGAGRIEVEIDRRADVDGLPAFTAPAQRIAPGDAAALLGGEVPPVDGSALGAPATWWTLPEGGVLVGWAGSEISLWVIPTGGDDWVLDKAVAGSDDVVALPELGDGGVGVSGPHLVETPHRRARADSIVAWEDGELSFRLEGEGDVNALVVIAAQLVAAADTNNTPPT
jgi:hypothetical protein